MCLVSWPITHLPAFRIGFTSCCPSPMANARASRNNVSISIVSSFQRVTRVLPFPITSFSLQPLRSGLDWIIGIRSAFKRSLYLYQAFRVLKSISSMPFFAIFTPSISISPSSVMLPSATRGTSPTIVNVLKGEGRSSVSISASARLAIPCATISGVKMPPLVENLRRPLLRAAIVSSVSPVSESVISVPKYFALSNASFSAFCWNSISTAAS